MATLERRIEALEKVLADAEMQAIVCNFVSVGKVTSEAASLRDSFGTKWTRLQGETEAEFIARATNEAPAKPGNLVVLHVSTTMVNEG